MLLVERTARQICTQETTAEERAVLPKYRDESWLELLHNLEIHRGRLVFQQLLGMPAGTDYVGGDRARLSASSGGSITSCTAVCNEVMRAGRHFATVEVYSGSMLSFGVIRPIKYWHMRTFNPYNAYMQSDLLSGRTDRWGSGDVHCCMYRQDGGCDWTDWRHVSSHLDQSLRDWEGAEPCYGRAKIGLLLDLDEGTLTAYKNGRRLGVMSNGLSGVYSWSIQVYGNHDLAIQRSDLTSTQS